MTHIKSKPVIIKLKSRSASIKSPTPEKKPGPEPYHKGSRQEGPPAIRKEIDTDSIRTAMISAFGERLKTNENGFYLDKRPISLDDLMLETNRIRKANGLAPVGKKREWMP